MAGISSQFIDLSDGEYHLIPANATNLILHLGASFDAETVQVSPDKTYKSPIQTEGQLGENIPLILTSGFNPIRSQVCQYIQVTPALANTKLYFGVS